MHGKSQCLHSLIQSKLVKEPYGLWPSEEQLPRRAEYRWLLLKEDIIDVRLFQSMSHVQSDRTCAHDNDPKRLDSHIMFVLAAADVGRTEGYLCWSYLKQMTYYKIHSIL